MDKTVKKKVAKATIENPIKDIRFSVIRKRNSANDAETLDGFHVVRADWILFDEKIVHCAPYDNHFLYEDPSGKPHRWHQMCTCGSPAVCVGYKAYERDGSVTTSSESSAPGEMFVCYIHATTGRHADGSQ
jgi:hypothetical protein